MSTGHEETKAGGTEAGAQSPADDEQEAPVAVLRQSPVGRLQAQPSPSPSRRTSIRAS
jgi:hypothetical protein